MAAASLEYHVNKAELISHAATAAGVSKTAAAAVLDACVGGIVTAVAAGDDVAIAGLGTFKAAKREARTGRNPLTGDKLKIPAKTVPKFSAASAFKAAVASGKKKSKK